MSEKKLDIQNIISEAVNAAVIAGLTGLDEKIQTAINLAMPIALQIGAEVGAKIGAEAGAAAVTRAIERERKVYRRKQYDWKYHNTKLLLRNYRRLNAYYQNAVFDQDRAENVDGDFEKVMRSIGRAADDEVVVESILRSYTTTRIIMTHVSKMLDCYKIMCERSNRPDDARHWRVLENLYLVDNCITAEKIAQKEFIDKRTVYRDIDICTEDLTILFFGVGGISDL